MSTSFPATPHPPSSAQGKRAPQKKRTRHTRKSQDDDSDGCDYVDKADHSSRFPKVGASQPLFECPFHKYDPGRHHRCQGYQRFCDLTQHIQRRHVLREDVPHCPRCRVEFRRSDSSRKSRDRHLRSMTCEPATASDTGVMLPEEYRTYAGALTGMSLAPPGEKWRLLWCQLFNSNPPSPYVESITPAAFLGSLPPLNPFQLPGNFAESNDYSLLLANYPRLFDPRIDDPNAIDPQRFDFPLNPPSEFPGFSNLVPPSASEHDALDIPLPADWGNYPFIGRASTETENTILDAPQHTRPGDHPNPPSNGRHDDSHNASHPEDSGYGSTAPNFCLQNGAEKMAGVAVDDARTIYSNVTNEDPLQTRDFVQELASDIYGKLKQSMGPDDWPLVSKSLPELLKAFAIRIGRGGDSQASRDVMYFIHREHRNIANSLQSLVLGPVEDAEVASRADVDNMSLRDKMNLWNQKLSADETKASDKDRFENVTDDELDTGALLMYNKMVLESEYYVWLIQSLKRELLLEWGGTDSPNEATSIRKQILSMLPSGNISKRICPTNHHVVFRFPTPSIEHLRSDRIVVTSSSHNLQLARISTYVDQTWPSFGRKVLSVASSLGNALQDQDVSKSHVSTALDDGTELVASVGQSHSLLKLIGSAYSVAEVGEQLAWLVAATLEFPTSANDNVILSIPSVTSIDKLTQNSRPIQWSDLDIPEPWFNTYPVSKPIAGVEIEVLADNTPLEEQSESPWTRFLGNSPAPPIIQGYPTARRPPGCPGLELSYDLLKAARTTGLGQTTTLKEAFVGLVLAGESNGVFYWHEPHACRCSTELFLETHGDKPEMECPDVLEAGRHIICDCELFMDTEHVKSPSASTSTSITSLTSGISSVSGDSVNIIPQDCEGPGFSFFKDVFQHIVQGYLRQAPNAGGSSVGNSTALPPGTHSSTSNGEPSRQSGSLKRHRENEDSEGDENNLQPRKILNGPPSGSSEKPSLACPFLKLDPIKHSECLLMKLTTVSYVKQHLRRKHIPSHYCQRCFMTFDNEASRDQHVFGEPCKARPMGRLDGISPQQSRVVFNKSKRGTVKEQWYAIWDILFPDERRPPSIYVDTDQSRNFLALRQYSQREGISIFIQRIRDNGRVLSSDVSEQEWRDIFRQAMNSMFRAFLESQHSASAEGSSQPENCVLNDPTLQRTMPDNGSTDSGLGLASHSPYRSHAGGLATIATLEASNVANATGEALNTGWVAQTDPIDPEQAPGVFNMDVLDGDQGISEETERTFEGIDWNAWHGTLFDSFNEYEPVVRLGNETNTWGGT